MPKIAYEPWKPGDDALYVVQEAERIIGVMRDQGFDLTLRQMYYQFVAHDLFPSDRTWVQNDRGAWVRDENGTPNAEPNYKWLGGILNRARLAGLLDWNSMVDRTRSIAGVGYFQTVEDLVTDLALYHSVDHWADQDDYMEVWVEKEALIQVVERAASRYGCPYFACRGYVSQSEQWAAANRLRAQVEQGKRVTVLHLGDHDPSGVDMSRDIRDRIRTFTTQDYLNDNFGYVTRFAGMSLEAAREGVPTTAIEKAMAARTAYDDSPPITVKRIALNMDQIVQYDPPPNPAKLTDSRSKEYVLEHGDQSWELDALDPATLVDLIDAEIQDVIDAPRWAARAAIQREEREALQYVSDNWDRIKAEFEAERS